MKSCCVFHFRHVHPRPQCLLISSPWQSMLGRCSLTSYFAKWMTLSEHWLPPKEMCRAMIFNWLKFINAEMKYWLIKAVDTHWKVLFKHIDEWQTRCDASIQKSTTNWYKLQQFPYCVPAATRTPNKWRFGFHLFAFCVETSAYPHNQTHFHSLFGAPFFHDSWHKIMFVNSIKTERHLVRHWIYENCINISCTITAARQSGGGFIRPLSLCCNVD